MRPFKPTSARVILVLAVAMAIGNLIFTGMRSTIPRAMDGVIRDKRILREHTAGGDDVCIIDLSTAKDIHVDRNVYAIVHMGDTVSKKSWSTTLRVNDQILSLSWSQDTRRMALAMPLIVGIIAWLLALRFGDRSTASAGK